MKKKVMAVVLAAVMVMGMSLTAMAASSTTSSNSGDAGVAVEKAAPGEAVATDTVEVAIVAPNGAVQAVTLTEYVASAEATVIQTVAVAHTASGQTAGKAVSEMMSRPATPMFQATINALGGKAGINDMGTKKTLASAQDAFGNTIASAGKIEGVTTGSLVMLMSVSADGTVEFVEGIVDPVTGQILGAFKNVPKTITVMVFIPAM